MLDRIADTPLAPDPDAGIAWTAYFRNQLGAGRFVLRASNQPEAEVAARMRLADNDILLHVLPGEHRALT